MGLWNIVKTAVIIEGVNHMLKGGKKNTRSGYDPGAWRRNIDRDNDRYRDLFCDEDSF